MLKKPATCKGCAIYGTGMGWVPATGSGDNGVLIVLEAAGADEEEKGIPVVGKAGQFLFSKLKQVGLERDEFRIHNVLSCRPPMNKLADQPYEEEVIAKCTPNLDRTIREFSESTRRKGKHPTILALGRVAFRSLMRMNGDMSTVDLESLMKSSYLSYPIRGPYGSTVIASHHPAFLIRGNQHLVPLLQFAAQRAVEVALSKERGHPVYWDDSEDLYLCDPTPDVWDKWVDDYAKVGSVVAFDIETPMKSGGDEEDIAREEDNDYTILRCSFCYTDGEYSTVSVPWTAPYLPGLKRIFSLDTPKVGWNSDNYDIPRITRHFNINGTCFDGMLAWHVLNSSMPKGLGFVSPFYNPDLAMWKHLSNAKPAVYNAIDSLATLRNWYGIERDLKRAGLWEVFDRHVMRLNGVLNYMTKKGVILDEQARDEAEVKVKEILSDANKRIQDAVPEGLRRYKVYKRTPKDTTSMVSVPARVTIKRCVRCGLDDVKADHFKSVGRKALNEGRPENGCVNAAPAVKVEVSKPCWAVPQDFKLSSKSLQEYATSQGHRMHIDFKTKRPTFDKNAIQEMRLSYPNDPLYREIGMFRQAQKLHTTYIGERGPYGRVKGGIRPFSDGRIHTTFTHNPSTLRLASQNPNLQNLPRPQGPDDPATLVRHMIRAAEGNVLAAADFSGIEAVLVGYESHAPDYIRLAKMDVHSFYTAYCLYETTDKINSADLPQLSWDNRKLATHLAAIKQEFKWERNNLYKHLVHAINFGQEAKGAQQTVFRTTGIKPEIPKLKQAMDIYRELFPEITKWHHDVRLKADKEGYLTNAFGYVHRFNRVFDWVNRGGRWETRNGPDSSKVLAFLPQSNASGILKEAVIRLYYDFFEEAGQYLRLVIHDEIFLECPQQRTDSVLALVMQEMERPVPELPLPEEWGMGTHLSIDSDSKVGFRWSEME